MKCEISKRAQLGRDVNHYLHNNQLFTFISLYDDEEPYPIEEVIAMQREHVAKLKKKCEERAQSEYLKDELLSYFTRRRN